LNKIFEKAGVTITKENKRDVDKTIHSIVGTSYKNCSATWKEVKKRIAENEDEFVNALRSKLAKS
jgi:hypothetical protein